MSRRRFLEITGALSLSTAWGHQGRTPDGNPIHLHRPSQERDLDEFIQSQLAAVNATGFAGAVTIGDDLVWAKGYGWADVDEKVPMTPDTLLNIASVSKTVTAAVVLKLWEDGRFHLDDDVNRFLPFSVRNPRYPDTPITFRQLLTHRSSIKDGPAYNPSYSCGDPNVPLGQWLEQYLSPDGDAFDPEENFHLWEPGTPSPPG